jgi:hypothetical protein
VNGHPCVFRAAGAIYENRQVSAHLHVGLDPARRDRGLVPHLQEEGKEGGEEGYAWSATTGKTAQNKCTLPGVGRPPRGVKGVNTKDTLLN